MRRLECLDLLTALSTFSNVFWIKLKARIVKSFKFEQYNTYLIPLKYFPILKTFLKFKFSLNLAFRNMSRCVWPGYSTHMVHECI